MSRSEDRKSTSLLAVDTGGTFTDILLLHEGHLTSLKVPSTPGNPAEAVLTGLRRILGAREGAGEGGEESVAGGIVASGLLLIHGSTVATNALLERKGARVFLVTNEGFQDVIEIGRQNRPQLYALTGHRPPPLVDRKDRLGIAGRLGPHGEEIVPLRPGELADLPGRLRDAEAVAVVLLHSYANPVHEEAVAEALGMLAVPISVSSRILPEFREYERTATTVANAYVAPLMEGYLRQIEAEAGVDRIRVMGSDGGALPISRACAEPVHTVLSGPAGGVVAALTWGRRLGMEQLLSFDMGGTSTDVSLIPGALLHTREGHLGDLPISISLLDIHTVGAGGGSVAHIDPGGALRVGPESAGAHPGPIAYGAGGTRLTVTDAHLWLGRLPGIGLLGGARPLDRGALVAPMTALAEAAGVSPDRIAEGIVEVSNAAMEGALRLISIERGVDPNGFVLVAFGGAAGLHAVELAERLGLAGVLIPPDPGLLSAFGMLVAPVVRERQRTVLLSSESTTSLEEVADLLRELEEEARAEMIGEGEREEGLVATHWVDARYRDQSFELRIPGEGWTTRFHEAHEARYGFRREGTPIEAVTLRVQVASPGLPAPECLTEDGEALPSKPSLVYWEGSRSEVPVLARSGLRSGKPVAGPLILTEYSATTWCPPGWSVERMAQGALYLSRA
ncbi:MAG: hydantoinase/oxoprolinase family protein [Gemmatimonadota bacterium]